MCIISIYFRPQGSTDDVDVCYCRGTGSEVAKDQEDRAPNIDAVGERREGSPPKQEVTDFVCMCESLFYEQR